VLYETQINGETRKVVANFSRKFLRAKPVPYRFNESW
jgi:hypothetical protein